MTPGRFDSMIRLYRPVYERTMVSSVRLEVRVNYPGRLVVRRVADGMKFRKGCCLMPDLRVTKITALAPADVLARAEQFFTSEHWQVQSRNGCAATFVRKPTLTWHEVLLTVLFSLCLVVPGAVYYTAARRRHRRDESIAVTAKPYGDRSEVVVQYLQGTERLMREFLADLV